MGENRDTEGIVTLVAFEIQQSAMGRVLSAASNTFYFAMELFQAAIRKKKFEDVFVVTEVNDGSVTVTHI
jgi:hypothetical protein